MRGSGDYTKIVELPVLTKINLVLSHTEDNYEQQSRGIARATKNGNYD